MKYLIIFIIVILIIAGVAYYYLVYKPGKQKPAPAPAQTPTPTPVPVPVISLDYQIGSWVAAKNDGIIFYDLYGQPTEIKKDKYQPVGVVVAMDNIWTKVDISFGRGGIPLPFTQRHYLVKKGDVIKMQS